MEDKQTPEEFKVIKHYVDSADVTNYVFYDEKGQPLAATFETAEYNTKLFNEAFNVVTRTGLTPEQMEKRIKELSNSCEFWSSALELEKQDKLLALKKQFDLEVRLKESVDLLDEAWLQIEYLQNKFGKTGTGESVLSRISSFVSKEKTE